MGCFCFGATSCARVKSTTKGVRTLILASFHSLNAVNLPPPMLCGTYSEEDTFQSCQKRQSTGPIWPPSLFVHVHRRSQHADYNLITI